MIKRLFVWTARDIAYWEQIRQNGLRKFITWYGVFITGGIFFIIFGLVTLFLWLRLVYGKPVTLTSVLFLLGLLLVVACISILAGITNSLITWVVEQRLYRKYSARSSQEITSPKDL